MTQTNAPTQLLTFYWLQSSSFVIRYFSLVAKLQLCNPPGEAPASRYRPELCPYSGMFCLNSI